ncbi:hypothetical protein BgiBS90_010369 [Biomphalaria glabrata]|nr:hypothetical protein BgiBS90_010369 [Biomphalaria glabrata]
MEANSKLEELPWVGRGALPGTLLWHGKPVSTSSLVARDVSRFAQQTVPRRVPDVALDGNRIVGARRWRGRRELKI